MKLESSLYKILIVYEDIETCKYIYELLIKEGYFVQLENLFNCEKIVNNKEFNLIVILSDMYKASILSLCSSIRAKYSMFALPIVLIASGYSTQEIIQVYNYGVNEYLTEPFEAKVFTIKIKTLLELRLQENYRIAAEEGFLKAKFKPHFIYNVINTVICYCRTQPEKSQQILREFSSYLRESLTFEEFGMLIPIDKEINLIKSYLAIEKLRFEDRLILEYDIESDIHCNIPPLIFQILVENAVVRAVMSKQSGGIVKITIKNQQDFVALRVEDNGVGIEQKELSIVAEDKLNNAELYNMSNINKTMNAIYGFEMHMDIHSEIETGTTITLLIPKKS
jgi:LytS/YehU family sensor histidine kinase